MVPRAAPLTHDGVLAELTKLSKSIDGDAIAGAFVASLGEKPGYWRAPLIALAAARAVKKHALGATFSGGQCRECGLPRKSKLEGMHEAGQCLPGDLAGALVVLREVAKRAPPPAPTKDDVARLSRLLALVGELPADAREGKLSDAIAKARLVRGSKYDRRHVIETLGACGILETPDHPGFTTRWTSFASRQDRPSSRVECDPPIAFWTAANGVNAANVKRWFGKLGVKAPKRAKPKPVAPARPAIKKQPKQRVTELEKGDVVAFLVKKKWIAAVVTDLFRHAGEVNPVVELLDFSSSSRPTPAMVRRKRARGAKWGKSLVRSPYVLFKLWSAEDGAGTRFLLATKAPVPSSRHLEDPFEGRPSFETIGDLEKIARRAGLV